MAFTDEKKGILTNDTKTMGSMDGPTVKLTPNENNPFAQHDYALVINTYEVESSNWAEEDYALAYHYKDVYSTRNFSERVREQMNYYPGMHQSGYVPEEDPTITNAQEMANNRMNFWNNAMDNPDAFMNGLRSRQQDFDYRDIFGSDTNAKTKAKNIGKMITECIPCFDRLLDLDDLIPNGDLLEVHLLNLQLRQDLLEQLMRLFRDPGMYIDICELLNLLARLCPQDLLSILALLTQYLAKLNLDIQFNIDFIVNLVGAILSPFLDALSQWLDKLIQLLLAPILCIVDHINETIMIAQSMKIPFSEVSTNISGDIGAALPGHQNLASGFGTGAQTGFGTTSAAWAEGEAERFETPDSQKYNPQKPEWPSEETELASDEMKEAWNPTLSEAEREERNQQWADLRARDAEKRNKVPAPLRGTSSDGTRWSKDDIPLSDKNYSGGAVYAEGNRNNPPENQNKPGEAGSYLDPAPLVNSVVQMRNIMQGAIRYVQDWFDYCVQMIYDLIGTDYGWMIKKRDNTFIKSRIIELIMMIKSIIEAVAKNGLKCGVNSNFDEGQLKFILEDGLNKFSDTQFKVLDDGSIQVTPPGSKVPPTVKHDVGVGTAADQEAQSTKNIEGGVSTGVGDISDTAKANDIKQKSVESGIIIKNCLKDVTAEELSQVKGWIAEYEVKYGGNS